MGPHAGQAACGSELIKFPGKIGSSREEGREAGFRRPACEDKLVGAMGNEPGSRPISPVAGIALLAIRGILLWIVVPLAICTWLPASFWLRRRGVNLDQFLGWVDLNFVACLQRTVLRPFFSSPIGWVPARLMPEVTHRLEPGFLA